jgi:hypothetical protein
VINARDLLFLRQAREGARDQPDNEEDGLSAWGATGFLPPSRHQHGFRSVPVDLSRAVIFWTTEGGADARLS